MVLAREHERKQLAWHRGNEARACHYARYIDAPCGHVVRILYRGSWLSRYSRAKYGRVDRLPSARRRGSHDVLSAAELVDG
jgi:hypothetical protein